MSQQLAIKMLNFTWICETKQ